MIVSDLQREERSRKRRRSEGKNRVSGNLLATSRDLETHYDPHSSRHRSEVFYCCVFDPSRKSSVSENVSGSANSLGCMRLCGRRTRQTSRCADKEWQRAKRDPFGSPIRIALQRGSGGRRLCGDGGLFPRRARAVRSGVRVTGGDCLAKDAKEAKVIWPLTTDA